MNPRLAAAATFMFAAMAMTAHANTPAEQCRAKHPDNHTAQLQCVRRAYAPPKPAPSLLTAPLAQQQVIFGLHDRRFPAYNNGKEHLGVDLAAAAGTPTRAVCDGTVVYNNTAYADIVSSVLIIEHDCPQPLGLVYGYYGHVLSERNDGEAVEAGNIIGTIKDWTGNSHLHLGLSTQFIEDNWGVLPKGATLRDIEAQGWINPLRYLVNTPHPARAPARARRAISSKKSHK